MSIYFFIKSGTVDLKNYTIKDIPGSTGRLDVISRCIIAAILNEKGFDDNVQIWVFLEKYGMLVFNPCFFDYELFPKNEILLSDFIVKLVKHKVTDQGYENNPLRHVKYYKKEIFSVLKAFLREGYNIYVLKESGNDFFKYSESIKSQKNVIFIIGSQTGAILNSKELNELNLPNLSLGTQSYLASSVIRLIKLNLMLLV